MAAAVIDTADEGLEDYFSTTFEKKLLVTVPDQDDLLTPATRLLEKRREMIEVEAELVVHTKRYTEEMERLQRRKDKLREDEAKLRKSLKDYDKYLRENDLRRKRAQKKAKHELEECTALENELTRLRALNATARELRERQRAQVKADEVYETYLKKVLELEPVYDEIGELLDRFATLKGTNEELIRQKELNTQRLEELQREALRSREEHKVEMLRLNNKLATLETRREQAMTERLHWENEAVQAEREACANTLLLGRLKMAAANLYALIQTRQGRTKERVASTERQLEKIETYIQDLASICDEYDRGRSWLVDA